MDNEEKIIDKAGLKLENGHISNDYELLFSKLQSIKKNINLLEKNFFKKDK